MSGNRFQEAITPGFSGVTIAVLNCTTANQGTRCFLVLGSPSVTVSTGNSSFVNFLAAAAGHPEPCGPFQKRFGATVSKFGLAAAAKE